MASAPAPDAVEFVIVGLIAAAVGASELVGRYRDAPLRALTSASALLYLLLNVAAGIGALFLIDAFGWTFGHHADESGFRAARALVAGFGAMALFRSSLFFLPVGDQSVGVGPSTALQAFLDAADRGVDRSRARRRGKEVERVLGPLDLKDPGKALPALALGLLQNPTEEQQRKLSEMIRSIESGNFDEPVKRYLIGLAILNLGGPAVLRGGAELAGRQRSGGLTRRLHP